MTAGDRVMRELERLEERAETVERVVERSKGLGEAGEQALRLVAEARHLRDVGNCCPRCGKGGDCDCQAPMRVDGAAS